MARFPGPLAGRTRFVFAGRFGSGKTEIAINFALRCLQPAAAGCQPARVALVDLDVVTPYFRSRDLVDLMHARGLEMLTPAAVERHLDTAALRPEVLGVLQQDEYPVVLDVGGDEQGARVLAQYSHVLRERGYSMLFVVNPYRPFTADVEGISEAIHQIERSSRLLVTGLVSNPNLMEGTTPAEFAAGQRIVEHAGERLALPLVFTAVDRQLMDRLGSFLPVDGVLPLERFFLPPWSEMSGDTPAVR